jgi:hypothetical protein
MLRRTDAACGLHRRVVPERWTSQNAKIIERKRLHVTSCFAVPGRPGPIGPRPCGAGAVALRSLRAAATAVL